MSLCIIAGSFNHAIKKYIKYHNNENAINKMVINQLLLSMLKRVNLYVYCNFPLFIENMLFYQK